MNPLQHAWQLPIPVGADARRRQNWRRWPRSLATPFGVAWLVLAGTLCGLSLLLVFQHVVRQGVQQGEARNQAIAAHAEGVWRCNALRSGSERAGCRVQLDAARAAAALSQRHAEPAAAIAVAHREP
jgi:hypothetical protein